MLGYESKVQILALKNRSSGELNKQLARIKNLKLKKITSLRASEVAEEGRNSINFRKLSIPVKQPPTLEAQKGGVIA